MSPPSAATIVGNVYRIAVANQDGVPMRPSTPVTILLRAPTADPNPASARFTGSTWQELPSERAGQAGLLLANVEELGDFAAVVRSSGGILGLDPVVLVAGLVTAAVSVAALVVFGARLRSRSQAQPGMRHRPSQDRPRRNRKRRGR